MKRSNKTPLLFAMLAGFGLLALGSSNASAAHYSSCDTEVGGPIRAVAGVSYARAGHYETRYQKVLVKPGHYHKVWHPPVVEKRYDECGYAYTVIVRPGHYHREWHPAKYETRAVKVWVPAPVVQPSHHKVYQVKHSSGHHHHGRHRKSKKRFGINVFLRF